jgi:KipI family sensor histidine kinase inhibitor
VSVRAAGDAALLVEAGAEPGAAARLRAIILRQNFPGIADVIPGAETVLVILEPKRVGLQGLAGRLRALVADGVDGIDRASEGQGAAGVSGAEGANGAGEVPGAREVPGAGEGGAIEIPVVYDGPDLDEVAGLTGLSREQVIERHAAAEYLVGWLGFSPGFGYLTGLDPELHVPRRDSPRTSVPAGSVAIAGPLAAVYPSASPGGWRLLGRTAARLWDDRREPPAVLAPGRRVRFRPVDELGDPGDLFPPGTRISDAPEPATERFIEVVRPGPFAIVTDLGRPGYGHLGVPRSGAADPDSLRLANRLVGNPEDAAAVELTLGGATLRFAGPAGSAPAWIAVTGAGTPVRLSPAPEAALGALADDSGLGVPFAVPNGATLTLGTPATAVRSYLAVRGGVAVAPVLGSRSADTLSGLGPSPLHAGDRLPVGGTAACGPIVADVAPRAAGSLAPGSLAGGSLVSGSLVSGSLAGGPEPAELRMVAGPRDDWFAPAAMDRLRAAVYEVTSDSNRSGLRLSGPDLPRARRDELPSEGMPLGALQVPPSGQPILFLADHPVTGGYPVIAVVAAADVARAAQLRPGDTIRFRLIPSPLA